MGLFNAKKEGGIMDAIRCDEQDYLIWKWRPVGRTADSTRKENAIRWGSSLRVKDGEAAVFVYGDGGAAQETIVGPYTGILKTDNLPLIASLVGLAYAGGTPFPAEVYFINLAKAVQIPFSVPFFNVYDPRYPDFACPVSVRGRITFCIDDYKCFIEKHRLTNFDLPQFSTQVREGVAKYAKGFIGSAPIEYNFPVVQIERFILDLSNAMQDALTEEMHSDFGVTLTRVDLSAIDCDKESEEYQKLYRLTGRQTVKTTIFKTDLGLITETSRELSIVKDENKRRKIERKTLEKKAGLRGVFGRWLGGMTGNRHKVDLETETETSVYNENAQFYFAVNGEQKGPFSIGTIREMAKSGIIPRSAYF